METPSSSPVTLGKYQTRGVLGRGAMGTVYDGWDPVIGRRVAIKTVRLLDNADAETQEGLARFKREAQAAGRLSHPNIVAVHDYGETNETAYIVMEFVQGHSLKERLDAHERFSVAETVRIMEQVLAGLQFSHDKAVIHRDIKPGNMMIAEDGRVKIADFGIARIESSVMTQDGTMLGTPAYMSPEQLMAQTVDARSDLYSAGVLLYQLLTGERPFEGGLTTIIHKALNTLPPRPSEISVTAPPSLDAVVARAMARRPDERYASAADFARALRGAFEAAGTLLPGAGFVSDDDATRIFQSPRGPGRSEVAPPPSPYRTRMPKPVLLGGAAGVLLLLLGGGTWFALWPSPPKPALLAEPSRLAAAPSLPNLPPAEPPPEAQKLPIPDAALSPAQPNDPAKLPTNEITTPETKRPENTIEPPRPPLQPVPDRMAMTLPNQAAIRDAFASLARSARCALPRFSVSDEGRISVSGLVGAGAPSAALRDAVQTTAPGAALIWEARAIDGPYCEIFDIIRPIAQPSSPFLGLALKNETTHLKEHDPVLPILKLPEFPAYLQVDYFSHDGSVAHLFPIRGVPNMTFAANATVPLGNSSNDRVEVGPPFGTDVIVAIASSVPLFPPGRIRDDETVQTYLPALKAAIEAAQRQKGKVTGRALVLETVP